MNRKLPTAKHHPTSPQSPAPSPQWRSAIAKMELPTKCSSASTVHGARQHNREKYRRRDPAQHLHDSDYGLERLRKILARLRHHLRRRTTPLRGNALPYARQFLDPDGTSRSGFHRRTKAPPSPSSRRPPTAAPVPRSAPSPRFTIICACFIPPSEFRIAPLAASRFRARVLSKSCSKS